MRRKEKRREKEKIEKKNKERMRDIRVQDELNLSLNVPKRPLIIFLQV